jgi:hypothetical protein
MGRFLCKAFPDGINGNKQQNNPEKSIPGYGVDGLLLGFKR